MNATARLAVSVALVVACSGEAKTSLGPQVSNLPVLRYLTDGTFYVTEGSADATFSDVVDGAAAGYYGTWSLAK